jgi:hypothetical protein
LREGIRKRYERIVALEVEYETRQELVRPEPRISELVPRSRHRFAFNGEKRFRAQSGVQNATVDGPLEMEFLRAFDGAAWQEYNRSSKSAFIDGRKAASFGRDAYVQALAILLRDDCRTLLWGGNDDYSLPVALDRTDLHWRVWPTLELVDGMPCHVLETDSKQRIWIDPATDHAMRFRELRQAIADRRGDEWPLSYRFALRYFRPVADDISLPWRIEGVRFLSTWMPESEWNQPSVLSVNEVTYLAVNDDVSDARFLLSFPPGTTVNDQVNGRSYRLGRTGQEINLGGPEWYLSLGRRR